MIQKDITITKANVMSEVYKITGYTAKGSEQEVEPDKVAATEDEIKLLESYYGEAITGMTDIVSNNGYLKSDDSTSCIFNISMPSNWNVNLLSALEKNMNQFMMNFICGRWFNISKKNEVNFYTSLSVEMKNKIIRILNERIKPTR